MKMFQTGTVLELTKAIGAEIKAPTFDLWCKNDILKPEHDTGGQGRPRMWSLMQVVGVLVAAKVRANERGCVLSYVSDIVAAFGKISEDELVELFDEGRTHFVMVHKGRPLLDDKRYDWPDVRAIYKLVSKA
jgi:hypothetical protein